ncbi:hypothetical protein GCM10029978_067680 [Actinoallomurus acanthiterrae]
MGRDSGMRRHARTVRALAARIGRRTRRTPARADRPRVAALLTAGLDEVHELLLSEIRSLEPERATDWQRFNALSDERRALAAHLNRRPLRPRGTRPRPRGRRR